MQEKLNEQNLLCSLPQREVFYLQDSLRAFEADHNPGHISELKVVRLVIIICY
jgi:hypothetical protein